MLRKIERYEVLDELGHGGMATVYRARDSKLDRMIALKVMHPHLRGAKEARDRFRREAQSVARLGHPRILEIYDYSGEESEESYIASQLLTGPTLRKWAETHAPVPAEIAACIGIEIAEALAAAHDKGIVHRDVKPENILLHENKELKLTDFGIADMVDSQSMTATGQILGSPGHMAPEQIEGGDTDARTDLFALGTVLYFLSTGRLPFVGKNPHQILKRIVDGEHPDPLRLEPKIGGRMRGILERLLKKRPEDRYADARALSAELRAFVLDVGIEDPSAELARFLAAPEVETKSINARIVARYTALGKTAQERGDIPSAHDCLSRVLAIDDGNQEVLALVQKIGRPRATDAQPRWMLGVLAVLGLLGVGVATRFIGGGDDDPVVLPVVENDDAGTAIVRRDAAADDDAGRDAAEELDAGRDAASNGGSGTRPVTPRAPRLVRFSFDPENVSVSIDDGPAMTTVMLGDGVELSVGAHRVAVQSNVPCCADESFGVVVEAGEGPLVLPLRRLRSRPAAFLPSGPAGLRVEVDGGRASGGREVFDVPIGPDRRERLRVVASAPGFVSQTTELMFRAGEMTEWTAELELAPPPPPPP